MPAFGAMAAGAAGTNIGSAWVTVGAQTAPFVSGMGAATTAVARFAKTAALIYGVVAAIKATTSAFVDFDKQLHNTWTLVDATASQIQKVGREVRAMARQYQVGSAEAQAALYQIYSAVFYGAEGMEILEQATKGAAAGLASLFATADMTTTVLNAYRMEAEKASYVNDLLFTAIRFGKTTLAELSHQFGRLAGVAAPVGASVADMTAAIATLTRQGIRTDWAITSLRQTLMQFIKPVKNLKEALKALGYTSGSALIRQVGFAQALKMVTAWAKENNVEMEAMFTNVRAITAVLPLATTAAGEFAKDQARMADSAGAATAAFEKQTKSWSFQLQRLTTLVGDFAISLGEVLMPAMKGLMLLLEGITTVLRPILSGFKLLGGPVLLGVIATTATLIGAWKLLTVVAGALSGSLLGVAAGVTAINLAQTTGLLTTMTPWGMRGAGGRFVSQTLLRTLLAKSGIGSLGLGLGMMGAGAVGLGVGVKALINLDFGIGEVSGLGKVKEGIGNALIATLGFAVGGKVLASLLGIAGPAGWVVGAAVAGAAIVIKIIHEIEVSAAERRADITEIATLAIAEVRLPSEVFGVRSLQTLAQDIIAQNDALEHTTETIKIVTSELEKYYDAQRYFWGDVKSWKLKETLEPGLRIMDDLVDTLSGLDGPFKDIVERTHDFGLSLGVVDDALQDMTFGVGPQAGGPSFLVPWTGGLDFSELARGMMTPIQLAWTDLMIEMKTGTTDASEALKVFTDSILASDLSITDLIPIIMKYGKSEEANAEIQVALNAVMEELLQKNIDLVPILRVFGKATEKTIQDALAMAAALNYTEDELRNLENALRGTISAINTFQATLNAIQLGDLGTALPELTADMVGALEDLGAGTTWEEAAKTIGYVAQTSGAVESLGSLFQQLANGPLGDANPLFRQWADQTTGFLDLFGKTDEELARDREAAQRKAEQEAKEAAAAAQKAFRDQFKQPILEGITTGNWKAAADTLIGFAQSKDAMMDFARNLSSANDVVIDEIEVLGLIVGSFSELTSAVDNMITLSQITGESTLALEVFKQSIEDLLSPIAGLEKKIREILGIEVPEVAAREIRSIMELLYGPGGTGFQSGGIVPGSGSGDIIPAVLEPGEFVVPKWMMAIPWLRNILLGTWGKRLQAGGFGDPIGSFGVDAPGIFSGFDFGGGLSLSSTFGADLDYVSSAIVSSGESAIATIESVAVVAEANVSTAVGEIVSLVSDAAQEICTLGGTCSEAATAVEDVAIAAEITSIVAETAAITTGRAAESFSGSISGLVEGLAKGRGGLEETIKSLQQQIADGVLSMEEEAAAKNKLYEIFTAMSSAADDYKARIQDQITAYEMLGWETDNIKQKMKEWQAYIRGITVSMYEWQVLLEGLEDGLAKLIDKLVGGSDKIKDFLKAFKPADIEAMINEVVSWGGEFGKSLMNLATSIASGNVIQSILVLIDIFKQVVQFIVDAAKEVIEAAKEVAAAFHDLAKKSEWYSRIQTALAAIQKGFLSILLGFLAPIAGLLEKIAGIFEENAERMGKSLNVPTGYKVTRAAWRAATPGEPGIAIGGEGPELPDWLTGIFEEFSERIQAIIDEITDFIGALNDLWESIAPAIMETFLPIIEYFADALKPLADWFKTDFLPFLQNQVLPTITRLFEAFKNKMPEVVSALGKLFKVINDNWPMIERWLTEELIDALDTLIGKFEIAAALIEAKSGDLMGSLKIIWESNSLSFWEKLKYSIGLGAIAVWEWVKEKFKPLGDVISFITKLIGGALTLALNLIIGVIGVVFAIIRTVFNAIIFVFNAIVSLINLIPFVNIPLIPYMEIPDIRLLQTGGKLLSSGLVYGHKGEVMAPASVSLGAGLGGGGQMIQNDIYMNGGLFYSEMKRVNRAEQLRRTGSSVGQRAWVNA